MAETPENPRELRPAPPRLSPDHRREAPRVTDPLAARPFRLNWSERIIVRLILRRLTRAMGRASEGKPMLEQLLHRIFGHWETTVIAIGLAVWHVVVGTQDPHALLGAILTAIAGAILPTPGKALK